MKRSPDDCETEGCEYLREPKHHLCWLCQVHVVARCFQNPGFHDLPELRRQLRRLELGKSVTLEERI